ncbi:hypothetical protein N7453_003809 [Penicillium expansum]|nr:hypothetical protein N7453_003809 [Penicillium expansum]
MQGANTLTAQTKVLRERLHDTQARMRLRCENIIYEMATRPRIAIDVKPWYALSKMVKSFFR